LHQIPDNSVNFRFDREKEIDYTKIRLFLEIMNLLEDYQFNRKGKVFIKWHYPIDNQEIFEMGKEFSEDVKLEFSLVPY
jgi:hypothetical protein